MKSPTIEEVRALGKRLREEKEANDSNRGYCVLRFPETSDTFAIEAFDRYYDEVRRFLHQYAQLLLQMNTFPKLEDTSKLEHWHDSLKVAGFSGVKSLSYEIMSLNWLLKKAILADGDTMLPLQVASHIAKVLERKAYKSNFTYDYELQQRDYAGDFDAYVAIKMEEIKQWQTLH